MTYFTKPDPLAPQTKARSVDINAISQAVASAFDKLAADVPLKIGTTNYAYDTGVAANVYAASMDPIVTAYTDGLQIRILPLRTSIDGPATLNINGLGAIPIIRVDGTPVKALDIQQNVPVELNYVASANVFYLPQTPAGDFVTMQAYVNNAKTSATNAAASAVAAANSAVSVSQIDTALRQKYMSSEITLLFHLVTGGSGSRNVVQGHMVDLATNSIYALQLKDSADAYFIKKCKFGNARIPGNVVDITPQTNLIVHQGLFLETVGAERWFWAGGDSNSQPQLVACRESDGIVNVYQFDPTLSPVANMGSGTWAGNATMCRDLSGTKLFIRLGRGSKDYILRYDFAAFKASSTTAIAEACFPVATEQYSGTSFQGIAADEDSIYVLSGNTTQTLAKLLYAYDYTGVIKTKRNIIPHYFDSFRYGNKCEVEGIQIVQLPNNQRILTMMVEMGSSAHNIHRLYSIPQFKGDGAFGNSTPGIYMNDYGMTSVGGMPVGDDACLFQVVNEQLAITRFGVRGLQSIGPTGGGFQMVIGTDNVANLVNRELATMEFWTNNTSRMTLEADRAQLNIGKGEVGPYPGNVPPGPKLILETGALTTTDTTATDQSNIFQMQWNEGSQDLGADEGVKLTFAAKLAGTLAAVIAGFGIKKVTSSDATTNSDVFIEVSPGTGQAPVKYFNFTSGGFFTPLTDAAQSIGTALKRWGSGFFAKMYLGAGSTFETSGTGSPEGVITAPVGSRYWREDGGSAGAPRLYWKASGAGNTGWLPGIDVITVKQTAVPSVTVTGTTVETLVETVTIPGGLIGKNGVLSITPMWSTNNSANTKTLKIKFGGVVFNTPQFTTTVSVVYSPIWIRNRGATNSQIGPPPSLAAQTGYGASVSAFTTSAIDTTVNQDVTFTITLANAADSATLEGYIIQVLPG